MGPILSVLLNSHAAEVSLLYVHICWFIFDALTQGYACYQQCSHEIVVPNAGIEFTTFKLIIITSCQFASTFAPHAIGTVKKTLQMAGKRRHWITLCMIRHDTETLSPLLAICEEDPPNTYEFCLKRVNNVGLWYFPWCFLEHNVEQTTGLPFIWDAMMVMSYNCDE